MPLPLDHQMREYLPHDMVAFPITFFENEFVSTPSRSISLHWHPELEMLTAERHALELQVGREILRLEPGFSILINGNVLHATHQIEGEEAEPMPNIEFWGTIVATDTSVVYQKYIRPIAADETLPYVVFGKEEPWHREVNHALHGVYRQMREQGACYEMSVQRYLSQIFETLYLHMDELPRITTSRMQMASRVRIQQMLQFIQNHFAENITLVDIAAAANVSRSEANRCFHTYLNCTPIEALIYYRLEAARKMLGESMLTLREISEACGFHSESYFSRRYRKAYGTAPGLGRK